MSLKRRNWRHSCTPFAADVCRAASFLLVLPSSHSCTFASRKGNAPQNRTRQQNETKHKNEKHQRALRPWQISPAWVAFLYYGRSFCVFCNARLPSPHVSSFILGRSHLSVSFFFSFWLFWPLVSSSAAFPRSSSRSVSGTKADGRECGQLASVLLLQPRLIHLL